MRLIAVVRVRVDRAEVAELALLDRQIQRIVLRCVSCCGLSCYGLGIICHGVSFYSRGFEIQGTIWFPSLSANNTNRLRGGVTA